MGYSWHFVYQCLI